jgi:RimJ/RimL family protein N-acetyltransferase
MYTFNVLESSREEEIMRLIGRSVARLEELGIHQWDEIYPDAGTIRKDLESGTMRGLFIDGVLAGIFVLNEYQDREYSDVAWEIDDPRPLVFHRLCVDPDWQGKGLAKRILGYVDEYAQNHGYRSLRFDAFSENPISLGLYRALGYRERGQVRFRKGLFFCFEKKYKN